MCRTPFLISRESCDSKPFPLGPGAVRLVNFPNNRESQVIALIGYFLFLFLHMQSMG